MSQTAISFNKVTKRYFKGGKYQPTLKEWIEAVLTQEGFQRPEFKALDNVSFKIKKGSVVGFIGSNGAGKSTILKLISRITYPSKGNMTVNGSIAGLLALGAGFHPDLTGRENIYLYSAILGLKKSKIKENYSKVIEFSGIEEFIETPIKHYSSGMVARLAFSIVIHIEAEILLIDEVLAVGDLAFRSKCMNFIKKYSSDPNHTVLYVSHSMESVQAICDEVIWLENGEIKMSGKVEKILPSYIKFQKNK